MLPGWCDEGVTVLRAPMVERRGSRVRDWSSATSHEVLGCSVQEAEPTETRQTERRAREINAVLFAPFDADIVDGDRVEASGTTYEVVGAPMTKRSPFGAVSHIKCRLAQWRG